MKASSYVFNEKRIDAHGGDKNETKSGKDEVKHDTTPVISGGILAPKSHQGSIGKIDSRHKDFIKIA
jgi:hypothetical protein